MFICPLDINFKSKLIMSEIMYQRRMSDGQSSGTSYVRDGDLGFGSSSPYQKGTPEASNYDVRQSSAYKIAYDLFSPLSDKQWLTRLEAIASRPATGSPSFTDDLGITQDFQQRRLEAYNAQIADINNLVNSYYEWRNTLPVTQVQQASDAGVNLAVSGGINSSQMSGAASSLSQLSGQGTDARGIISGAIGTVSSLMSSISGVYKSAEDIKNARVGLDVQKSTLLADEKKFALSFTNAMSEAGFDMTETSLSSYDDIDQWWKHNQADPEVQSRANSAFMKLLRSDVNMAPYRSVFMNDSGDFEYNIDKLIARATGVDSLSELDQSMEMFAEYEMQSMLLDKLTSFNQSVYNENYTSTLDGSAAALSENAIHGLDVSQSTLNSLRSDLNSEFIQSFADRWRTSRSPEAKFALLQMVADLNLDEQSAMELVNILGSPTLAKGADKVISELIDVGGNFAKRLSKAFGSKKTNNKR